MWSLIKKELKAFFDHPTAYILLIVFVVVNSFFFFRVIFVSGLSTLKPMFDFLPWLWLFLVPAITMRLVAEERRIGTFDLLLLQYKLWQIIIAKITAVLIFLIVALLLTLPIPVWLAHFGSFDWGQIAAQYLAALLLALALTTIGFFASTLTKNQVVAFIISLFISFFLIIAGLEVVIVETSGIIRTIFEQLSLLTHYQNVSRGVVDLNDLIYFVSVPFVFISLSYWLVVRWSANRRRRVYRQLKAGVVLLVAISILVNLLAGDLPGRVDLTSGRFYTLASGSQQILQEFNDIVTIKFFYSRTLPPQFSVLRDEVKDLLRDLQKAAGDNLQVEYIVADENEESRNQAHSLGITPVQFNILRQQEFTLQQGYFGLAVLYQDQHETIPFVQSSSDLEYRLVSAIYKLTASDKKKIAFLTGHGEKSRYSELGSFNQELSKQYEVEELQLENDQGEVRSVPTDVAAVIIAGPKEEIKPAEIEKLQQFVDGGGALMLLLDAVNIAPQFLQVTINPYSGEKLAELFGVKLNQDIVFDLQANESVSFGGGLISYIIPYPFWLRAKVAQPNSLGSSLVSVTLPWASSLTVESEREGLEIKPLLITTKFAGLQTQPFNVAPDVRLPSTDLAERTLAVTIMKGLATDQVEQSAAIGRVVVLGDSDFISEDFVRQRGGQTNLTFALQAVEWLTQDQRLATIRAKQRDPAPLVFTQKNQTTLIRWFNLVGVPILVALYAVFHLWRRRRRRL